MPTSPVVPVSIFAKALPPDHSRPNFVYAQPLIRKWSDQDTMLPIVPSHLSSNYIAAQIPSQQSLLSSANVNWHYWNEPITSRAAMAGSTISASGAPLITTDLVKSNHSSKARPSQSSYNDKVNTWNHDQGSLAGLDGYSKATLPATSLTDPDTVVTSISLSDQGGVPSSVNGTLQALNAVITAGPVAVGSASIGGTSVPLQQETKTKALVQQAAPAAVVSTITPVPIISDVRTGPRVQTAVPTSQAVAAGYTHPALIDEFNTQSVSNTGSGTFNWYNYNPYGGPLLSSGQYSIVNGYLTIQSDASGYSSGLTTIDSLNPAVSRPGAIAVNTGKGVTFQYGYFECRMKFDATLSPETAAGQSWPAFWSNAIQGPQDQTNTYTELDFMEGYPVAKSPYVSIATTVHEWTRGWNANGAPSGNNSNFQNSNNTLGVPAGLNLSDFNTYGCLWKPSEIDWYINNKLVTSVAVGSGTAYPSTGADAMYLVLGTGKNWPITVDYVHVWQ
jgi:beta-glucanase (GH16 family)